MINYIRFPLYKSWGQVFRVPVGQNLKAQRLDATDAFEVTALYLDIDQGNTVITVPQPTGRRTIEVTISRPNGTSFTERVTRSTPESGRKFTLDAGQTVRINNLNSNDLISSSKPVQANLITGDERSRYELRWYSLPPVDQFVNDYYTPVTRVSGTNGGTAVYLYNPGSNPITVVDETRDGTLTNHPIGAGEVVLVELNRNNDLNSGHRFYTRNNEPFFGLTVTDRSRNGDINDWGTPLASDLTPRVIVGLGRACTDGPRLSNRHRDTTCFRGRSPSNSVHPSKVWVTPTEDAKFNVDYNCDGTVESVFPTSGRFADKLESVLIIDPLDQDMTGACINAVGRDGGEVKFAAAWGQDGSVDADRNSELDLGSYLYLTWSMLLRLCCTSYGHGHGIQHFDVCNTYLLT